MELSPVDDELRIHEERPIKTKTNDGMIKSLIDMDDATRELANKRKQKIQTKSKPSETRISVKGCESAIT
jgi:hypothetical protein